MKIRTKILIAWLATLLFIGVTITGIWYHTSNRLSNTYLKNVSDSTMKDAYHAFEYLLTDTSYMATLIATNKANIIEPVMELNHEEISRNGQWNQTYLFNRRMILDYIKSLNGHKYYISGIAVAAMLVAAVREVQRKTQAETRMGAQAKPQRETRTNPQKETRMEPRRMERLRLPSGPGFRPTTSQRH